MAAVNLNELLAQEPVSTSAPCRIDMGGTLDINTFYLPLRHLKPCTFNIALAMRTKVDLTPFKSGWIKVSSRGFEDAAFAVDEAPFNHPLGLIFAIAAYFRATGVHIHIDSASPVRSALGGSSVAAVALITAFSSLYQHLGEKKISVNEVAMLAHVIEQSVSKAPCGIQDMLAATFGGVNAWYWTASPGQSVYTRHKLVQGKDCLALKDNLLIAYCGVPHESHDINGKWSYQFLSGQFRSLWVEIVRATQKFVQCFEKKDYLGAGAAMNRETDLRCEMTPEVLDDIGRKLSATARENNCGARFTGAGGGGCVWALGETEAIGRLRPLWLSILKQNPEACLLDTTLDPDGVL